MKYLIATLLAVSVVQSYAGMSDLDAIGLIESGGNDRKVGSAGEVSRYQILPKVWQAYTRSREYRNSWVAREIARKHLGVLMQAFRMEAGRPAGDFDLYVMWNAGIGYYRKMGFRAANVHPTIRDRAQRFVNLKQLDSPSSAANAGRLASN